MKLSAQDADTNKRDDAVCILLKPTRSWIYAFLSRFGRVGNAQKPMEKPGWMPLPHSPQDIRIYPLTSCSHGATRMWKKTEIEEAQSTKPQPAVSEYIHPEPQPIEEQVMIGKTIHIKGDLVGEEDLLIEGCIDGKVQLPKHNVTVGKTGHVKADIYGNSIIIEGDVEGNLFGADQLVLKKSCKVRGNITAPRVILEDGSNFKGSVDMNPGEERQKSAPIQNPSSEKQFDQGAVNPGKTAAAMDIAEI